MNYVLTMFFVAAISLSALKNIRWSVYVAVFALAFMPIYLFVPIGNNSIPARILVLFVLAILCLMWMIQKGQVIKSFIDQVKLVKYVIFLTIAFFLFSPMASGQLWHGSSNWSWSIKNSGYDFLDSIGILLLVLAIIRRENAVYGVLAALTFGLFVSEILTVIEYQSRQILLSSLVDINSISGEEFFIDRSWDVPGLFGYRARALFDNHLMLGTYIAVSWPIAWVVYINSQPGWQKWIAKISLIFVPVTLLLCGARSGMVVFAVGVSLLFIIKMQLKFGKNFIWFIRVLGILLFILISIKGLDIINSPEKMFSDGSAIDRINQYSDVFDLLVKQPWVGYGQGLEFGNERFLMYIDSYFLVVLLEGGMIGFGIFLLIWLVVLKHATTLIRYSREMREQNIALALMISVLSLLGEQFFISKPWNNIYLYIFEGLIVVQLIKFNYPAAYRQKTINV